ncbi:MAG: LysR family transcriptional regulator [Rickettsiales bacterium]|nr:LysR family transcriptional regulator [Rickettsiales bacterium]
MKNENNFYYKKNRLNQLRGFCSVVQCGCSGVKAAKRTNMEPAAISKQVSTLERDLGTKLFDRLSRKLVLTKEGKLFYKLAVEELQRMESLFENFNSSLKEMNENTLNIGLYYAAAAYIFPKILGKMLEKPEFKNIKIKIFNIRRDEATKKIIDKEIDFAFFPMSVDTEIPVEIETEKHFRSNHTLICSKNHPLANIEKVTREQIESYDFLVRDTKTSFYIAENFNLQKGNFDFQNATPKITMELVRYTNTITAIPEIMFKNECSKLYPDIANKDISHLMPEGYFYTLRLKNSIVKDSVKWLMDELNKQEF